MSDYDALIAQAQTAYQEFVRGNSDLAEEGTYDATFEGGYLAGHRAARTLTTVVTTTEELDALPARSIILDDQDDVMRKDYNGEWWVIDRSERNEQHVALPARVLHTPEAAQ